VRGMLLGYSGAEKASQDLRTGLSLARHLRLDIVRRLAPLLAMQSTIGRIGRDEYYISNVAVSPAWRNRGIGALLMRAAFVEAERDGMRSVVLDVETDNPDAQRLYERLGFRVTGETSPIVLQGEAFAFRRMARPVESGYSRFDSR